MIIRKTFIGGAGAALVLAGCASGVQHMRPLPVAPYTHLRLNSCNAYGSNIVECQLEYGSGFGWQRLGPVQPNSRPYVASSGDYQYQVSSCLPMQRVQEQLPIYLCEIYGVRSGADAGSVFIKGGTAVRLAKVLGDREQQQYRWTPDVWSQIRS